MSVASLENENSNLLKLTTKVDEIKYLKDKRKHTIMKTFWRVLRLIMIFIKKSINVWKKNKALLTIAEILLGLGSAITTSALSKLNPTVGTVLTTNTDLITSIAILILN